MQEQVDLLNIKEKDNKIETFKKAINNLEGKL